MLMPAVFQYEAAEIRVVTDDNGDPWWVAKDICEVLELKNPASSLALLDDDERGIHNMDTPGGPQDMATINEPGLYSLILRSRKKEAKDFKRWVTHEVIPSVRKNGAYNLSAISRKQLAQMIIEAEERAELLEMNNKLLTAENRTLLPKAEVYDQFIAAKNAINIGVFAKMIGKGPIRLFRQLRQMGILYQRKGQNLPMQDLLERGYFEVKIAPIVIGEQIHNKATTLITPKGQEWLYRKLNSDTVKVS